MAAGRQVRTSTATVSAVPLPATFPDLGALDLFCTVVELGSLSRAAEAHGIAQPSASSRIRTLERQLGVVLLSRSTAGSVPTPDGLLVAEWASAVIHAARALQGGVDALRPRKGGRLRVAASYTIAEFLLPGWMATVQRTGTVVELEVMNSTRVLDAVRAERADLGFIESPGDTKGLRAAVIGADELCVVVAAEHPWARRRTPLGASLLAATALVAREAGSGTREALDAALTAAGHSVAAVALELGSTTGVKTAVAAGVGPAVLSRLAVEAELGSGRLVQVAVTELDLQRTLRAVWKTGAAPGGPAGPLIAAARRSFVASRP